MDSNYWLENKSQSQIGISYSRLEKRFQLGIGKSNQRLENTYQVRQESPIRDRKINSYQRQDSGMAEEEEEEEKTNL